LVVVLVGGGIEAFVFRHGGVMPYVLRGLLATTAENDQ
jgi:hypothetical protein